MYSIGGSSLWRQGTSSCYGTLTGKGYAKHIFPVMSDYYSQVLSTNLDRPLCFVYDNTPDHRAKITQDAH